MRIMLFEDAIFLNKKSEYISQIILKYHIIICLYVLLNPTNENKKKQTGILKSNLNENNILHMKNILLH